MVKPLCIDLFCGLGGWTEGFLAEGYDVVGFDIERHQYGDHKYPAQLVLQDVLTLTGAQFKGKARVIVASPPCTEPSYRAMPWSRAKALNAIGPPHKFIELFNACFRIAREAEVPLVIENVRGAQPWVGRAAWHFGSYYLWGDLPALMPMTRSAVKCGGRQFIDDFFHTEKCSRPIAARELNEGNKIGGDWFSDPNSTCRKHGSKSKGRKMASAQIAKIPFPLASHIARCFL